MSLKFPRSPGGTRQKPGGRLSGGEVRKKFYDFFMGVFLIGFIFTNQSLAAKAQGPGSQELEYEIPSEIIEYCEIVGQEYDICPELLESMAYNESRFIPTVTNGKCYGLLQVNIKVHADRIAKYGWTEEDMFDPYKNIMVAADYLKELYDTYGDDNPIVLSYYSGNCNDIAKYKEYGFLSPYVDDVLTRSAEYERIHGK